MTTPPTTTAPVRPGWDEQWRRVQRRYERFQQIDAGLEHTIDSDHYKDAVVAFFMDCCHLKDWLKNDPGTSALTKDVEKVVHASLNLKLCGDLANGAKHLTLNNPKVGSGAGFGPTNYDMTFGAVAPTVVGGPIRARQPTLKPKYTVEADTATYDAFEVATRCVDEWRA